MDPIFPPSVTDLSWVFVAAPIAAIAAIVLTLRLRFPQARLLPAAFRGMQPQDGETGHAPGLGVALAAATAVGGGGAVGVASAIALGGAGALGWLLLFGLLLSPLQVGATLLAAVNPSSSTGMDAPNSLAARAGRDGSPVLRIVLLITGFLAALAVGGVLTGQAALSVGEAVMPGSGAVLLGAVCVVAAALGLMPREKSASLAGWLAVGALIILLVIGLLAAFSKPSLVIGAASRAITDALDGAAAAGGFSGALVAEIAVAALSLALPSLASASVLPEPLVGAATSARRGAITAALGPFVTTLVLFVVGLGTVATGAYFEHVDDERPMTELVAYRGEFESISQRREEDRLWSTATRIREGTSRDPHLIFATPRGSVKSAHYSYYGASADLAIRFRDGRPVQLLRSKEERLGALDAVPLSQAQHIMIKGQMLPTGGRLLAATASRAGAGFGARGVLVSLLVLAAIAMMVWGFTLVRLGGKEGNKFLALLTPLVALLALVPTIQGIATMVAIGVAAAFVIVSCWAVLRRFSEVGERVG